MVWFCKKQTDGYLRLDRRNAFFFESLQISAALLRMEGHNSSDNDNLDSLELMMQHGYETKVGLTDEKGGGMRKGYDGGGNNSVNDVHRKLSLLEPGEEGNNMGLYDKPLPCFGCGIGWFSFVAGFICPPFWYYATVLYFGNYRHPKDPRERAGLAASAIAALIFTIVVLVTLLAALTSSASRPH